MPQLRPSGIHGSSSRSTGRGPYRRRPRPEERDGPRGSRSQLHHATQFRRMSRGTEAAAAGGDAALTTSRQRAIFAVTALGAFMASLDLSIVNVAFPVLAHSFPHDSRATLAWVTTGYGIVSGSLLVAAGRTADRLGSRRVFFAGLAIFCLGSTLCALAPSVPLLVAGRVVQGCGAAALLPSSLGLLLGAFPQQRRSQVVALWGGVGALAVATGPSFGAALIAAGGWRWVFVVNLPVGAVAWLAGRRVLAETRPGTTRAAPDYLGVVLVSAALAALVLGISEGPTWGWSSGPVGACFAGGRLGGWALPGAPPPPFRACPRPHLVPITVLQRGQRRHLPLRHGVLRHAAGQHLVPDQRVALLDPEGRSGGDPRSPGGGGGVRAGRSPGGALRVPARPVGRVRGLCLRPGLVRHEGRAPTGLRGDLATGHADHRPRDRPHLPRAERGGGLQPAPRAVRRGQRRQPDRPPGGGRLRRGLAGGDPRRPDRGRGGGGELP